MKFTSYIPSVAVMVVLCGGCTSYHWLLRPGVTGEVVDSQTGTPIAGAQVMFSRDPNLYRNWYVNTNSGLRVTNTFSGVDGKFSIPPLQKWGLVDTTAPNDGDFYALVVRQDGFQPFTNTFWYPSGDYPTGRYEDAPVVEASTNFGEIQLEKVRK
jgi:hypothetical protein